MSCFRREVLGKDGPGAADLETRADLLEEKPLVERPLGQLGKEPLQSLEEGCGWAAFWPFEEGGAGLLSVLGAREVSVCRVGGRSLLREFLPHKEGNAVQAGLEDPHGW